ncbi:hypothetical protein SUGI_0101490 [Cryptomeria japonica]|nr:hypothetical protein SUGI_0101490 [Cryptomeria japonica]
MNSFDFCNMRLSGEERVMDLVGYLTLDEKVSQLGTMSRANALLWAMAPALCGVQFGTALLRFVVHLVGGFSAIMSDVRWGFGSLQREYFSSHDGLDSLMKVISALKKT